MNGRRLILFTALAYVTFGGGVAKRHIKLRFPAADDDDATRCGAENDDHLASTPMKMHKCFYTDCFAKFSFYDRDQPTSRRRMAGDRMTKRPNCNKWGKGANGLVDGGGSADYYVPTYSTDGKAPGVVTPSATRSAASVSAPGWLAANRATSLVPQMEFWKKNWASTINKDTANFGKCYMGMQREGHTQPPEDGYANCMYDQPPTECECRTVFCVVEIAEEKLADDAAEDAWMSFKRHECNFIARIEDVHPHKKLPRYTMWLIFGLSSLTGLMVTAYYYFTYGAEIVIYKEGGSEGGSNASN